VGRVRIAGARRDDQPADDEEAGEMSGLSDPHRVQATAERYYERAEVLLAQGRLQDAEQELRAGLALEPEGPELLVGLANCLVEQGELDEAETVIGEALRVAPDDAFAHGILHDLLERRGDYDGAEDAIRHAIALDPDDPQYHSAYSLLLLELERWEPALAAADAALARDPDDREALISRVFAQVSLGRADEALEDARRQLANDPADAGAHAMMGVASMATGDHRGAFENLSEAQRIDPTKDWVGDFGLVGLALTGRPLYSALIASLLAGRRRGGVRRAPGPGAVLLGPVALLATSSRVLPGPLSTIVLRCSRYGRLAVSREDAVATTGVGGLLVLTAMASVVAAVAGRLVAAIGVLWLGLLGLTVAGVALGADPWGRRALVARVAAVHAAGLALWAAVTMLVLA
jgi:tetratricopeptide (TPR) repeat protein